MTGGVVARTVTFTSLPSSWKTLSLMAVTLSGKITSVSFVLLNDDDIKVCNAGDSVISLSDEALWNAPEPNFITVGGRVILVNEEPEKASAATSVKPVKLMNSSNDEIVEFDLNTVPMVFHRYYPV